MAPKARLPSFDECLVMMRSRNPQRAEDGFHYLLPRSKEHVNGLISAFEAETQHGVRCWLLELIGEARSEAAFDLLCEHARGPDEALRIWAVRGLEKLDTPIARRFLRAAET